MTRAFPDGAFSETVLRARRFVLRPFTEADIPDVLAACSDELTQRWLPLPDPYTLDAAASFCREKAPWFRESGDGIQFAIASPETGRLLGNICLKKTDWRARATEIGYWMAPWARGQGLMTQACRTVADWALDEQGFQRVALLAATGNTASAKVAAGAGFRREGVLRNAGITHSGRVDLIAFSKVPEDLRPAASREPQR